MAGLAAVARRAGAHARGDGRRGALAVAAFLAGFGTGLRSQVALADGPADRADDRCDCEKGARPLFRRRVVRLGVSALACSPGSFRSSSSAADWRAYWHALFNQGAEDLTGIEMLWTTPTLHQLGAGARARVRGAVGPAGRRRRSSSRSRSPALFGCCPACRADRCWLSPSRSCRTCVFDLLFQETVTTRYALPLVVPIAYLAVRGLAAIGDAGRLRPSRSSCRCAGAVQRAHRRHVARGVRGAGGAGVPAARRHARRERRQTPSARARAGDASARRDGSAAADRVDGRRPAGLAAAICRRRRSTSGSSS